MIPLPPHTFLARGDTLESGKEIGRFVNNDWRHSSSMFAGITPSQNLTTVAETWSSVQNSPKASWYTWDTSPFAQSANLTRIEPFTSIRPEISLPSWIKGVSARPRHTPGSVIFIDQNGSYSEDNGSLFWDETTNRLGIGTGNPTAALDIAAPTAETASIHLGASTGTNPSAPTIGDLWFNGSNLFFQKDANTTVDLLDEQDYFSIRQNGVELEKRSALNFLGSGIECSDNALDNSIDCLFLRGITIHDVTYSELVSLISANNLFPGDQYRLTDFRTRYRIPFTDLVPAVHTGETEVLVLTANSQNSLNILAVSEAFPQDIIHYTVRNDILNDTNVDRGYILYRKDTVKNVEAWEDFRNMVFRRWETEVGNGVYAKLCQSEAPTGARYKDFPMFADYNNRTSEVSINHHRSLDNEGNELSNIIFMGDAYKIRFPDGAHDATFLGNASNCTFGFCSGPTFYGDLNNVDVGENNRLIAYGSLYNTYIRKNGVNHPLVIYGNLTNVEVLSNYDRDEIIGDYSDVLFGLASNEEDTVLKSPSDEEALAQSSDNSSENSPEQETYRELLDAQSSHLQEQKDKLSALENDTNSLDLRTSQNDEQIGRIENIVEALAQQLNEIRDTVDSYILSTASESIPAENSPSKSIGQSVICPEYFELDTQGECTILQIDSNNDLIEDMTGNRINDGKSAVILTSAARGQARIFLTPRRVIESPLAVTEIYDNEAFKVEISSIVSEKIVFDWWIAEEY